MQLRHAVSTMFGAVAAMTRYAHHITIASFLPQPCAASELAARIVSPWTTSSSMSQPLADLGLGIVPLGFVVVRGGDVSDHASDVRIFECELLRPAAVLRRQLPLLHAAFIAPVRATRIS